MGARERDEMDGEGAGNAGMMGSTSDEPRDAHVLRELLRSMGLSEGEYEPRVLHQLLELAYRLPYLSSLRFCLIIPFYRKLNSL